MKQKVLNILKERNLDSSKYNLDQLYDAGIKNIISNIDYYYDKPYTCESVLKELFTRGVVNSINSI